MVEDVVENVVEDMVESKVHDMIEDMIEVEMMEGDVTWYICGHTL